MDGDTVIYGGASELKATLEYDFEVERAFSYRGLSTTQKIEHLAVFVSRLWQIHIFAEGNTRSTAVFFIKYLRTLGFDVTNDIFAENAWYFRNALVRANYNNLKAGIHETREYLELFLRNLILNEKMNFAIDICTSADVLKWCENRTLKHKNRTLVHKNRTLKRRNRTLMPAVCLKVICSQQS